MRPPFDSRLSSDLHALGWDDSWAASFDAHGTGGPALYPGRVARVDRGFVDLFTPIGEVRAATIRGGDVCVGDWVVVRDREGRREVAAVLDRRGAIVRGAVGRESRGGLSGDSRGQTLAANVDVALVVEPAAIDLDLRARGQGRGRGHAGHTGEGTGEAPDGARRRREAPRGGGPDLGRIERLIALGWESGATPVVLITKADLVAHPERVLADVAHAAPGVDIHAVSARTGIGLSAVRAHLHNDPRLDLDGAAGHARGGTGAERRPPGRTAVLLGASGAGKSTLVNALAGAPLMRTQQVRASDGRGRHTTTHRELIVLPGGGAIIDTPGLRRIGLYDADGGLSKAFREIEELAAGCRFSDCAHRGEPGCAVQGAVDAGLLPERRLARWHKLRREAEWMASRTDARRRAERNRRWRRMARQQRRGRGR